MYISCVQKDILINAIVDLLYILVIGQLTVNPINCALSAAATARIAASATDPRRSLSEARDLQLVGL